MKYDDFTELIRSELSSVCGPEFSVSVYEALKNNSVVHKGVSIKEQNSNIAPTIYMEEYYTDYCDGKDIQEIINEILRVYSDNRLGPDMDTELFRDFSWVKDRIFFKLINAKKNMELLQRVPSFNYLDLAGVYGVYMGSYRDSFSSVMISNEHIKLWGVREDEIMDIALRNTPDILPYAVWSMKDLLAEMGVEPPDHSGDIPMYIISNKERVNGAAAVMYRGILKKMAGNLASDLYILPSSVHEMIIVPADDSMSPEYLAEMITEVNDTQVSREEILSYSLYRYVRDGDAVELVCPATGGCRASA